jgi:hypothetical protein
MYHSSSQLFRQHIRYRQRDVSPWGVVLAGALDQIGRTVRVMNIGAKHDTFNVLPSIAVTNWRLRPLIFLSGS